jgi:hypothetical protein
MITEDDQVAWQAFPKKITDVVLRMNEYMEYARANEGNASRYIDHLDRYVRTFVKDNNFSQNCWKTLTVSMVDEMYFQVS